MFADPFSNLMLVVLLFFAGLLIMFIFMMRSIEANWRNQEETRRQMALSLTDLERKVGELSFLFRAIHGEKENPNQGLDPDAQRRLPELSLAPDNQDDAPPDDVLRLDEPYCPGAAPHAPAQSQPELPDLPDLLDEIAPEGKYGHSQAGNNRGK